MKKCMFFPQATEERPGDSTDAPPESSAAHTDPAEIQGLFPCPCCGCLTLPDSPDKAIAFICPVCFWENDVFIGSDNEPSDENGGISLRQARSHYAQCGACRERMTPYVRKPHPEEIPS